MTIEQMAQKSGHFEHNGKEYVLIKQPYIDGPVGAPYFVSMAICPQDGVGEDGAYNIYDILWNCTEEWLAGDMDDEGDACDWDNPDEVTETMKGYDLGRDYIF